MSDYVDPCPCGWLHDPQKPVVVRLLSLPNIKNGFPVRCRIALIFTSKCRAWIMKSSVAAELGESSAAIRARVQAARDIQNKRFADNGSDIICNADMRVREIRQFCKLQDEGVVLTTVGSVEVLESDAGGIVDLAGSEEIQSAHLAEVPHASLPSEVAAKCHVIKCNGNELVTWRNDCKWLHYGELNRQVS